MKGLLTRSAPMGCSMSRKRLARSGWLFAAFPLVLAVMSLGTPAVDAQTLDNSASGTSNGMTLNTSNANVSLSRIGSVTTTLVGEVNPNVFLTASDSEDFTITLLASIQPGDAGIQTIRVQQPTGWSDLSLRNLWVGGVQLTEQCPTPGVGGFCVTASGDSLVLTLGETIVTDSTGIDLDLTANPAPTTGPGTFVVNVGNGSLEDQAVSGNADNDPMTSNSLDIEVRRSQGVVLRVEWLTNKSKVVIGEGVVMTAIVRNLTDEEVENVILDATLPRGFKPVENSARLDGAPTAPPRVAHNVEFDLGTIAAFSDANANGTADPGEPGYHVLTLQVVAGSSVSLGKHPTEAVARDFCDDCYISNVATAEIEVVPDENFDLGTILGKVFEDHNEDGWQDEGETGVAFARVALDDGSYVTADEYGRFHFPVVAAGQRLLKIDLNSIPGARATTDEALVVRITPGLLVQANFGIVRQIETAQIGQEQVLGTLLVGELDSAPIDVLGNTTNFRLVVNGVPIDMPVVEAQMFHLGQLDRFETGSLGQATPASFHFAVPKDRSFSTWRLDFYDRRAQQVHTIKGQGNPPARVPWNGRLGQSGPIPGSHLEYQFEAVDTEGNRFLSSRHTMSVIESSVVDLSLTGDAFESNRAILSPRAKRALRDAAEVIRTHPDEQILIEGHTDSVGSDDHNLRLSKSRAEAAMRFLTEDLGLPRNQFVTRAFGESRPIASNADPAGRQLNRRVVIRGNVKNVTERRVIDPYRTLARVEVNGRVLELDPLGRFFDRIEDPRVQQIDVKMVDESGRAAQFGIVLPKLELLELGTPQVVRTDGTSSTAHLVGQTSPTNAIFVNGRAHDADENGVFRVPIEGDQTVITQGIQIQSASGIQRVANVQFSKRSTLADGSPVALQDRVPPMTVDFPPAGETLGTHSLAITGTTEPGNTVAANGTQLSVDSDGRFSGVVQLPAGKSRVAVTVKDPEGNEGVVERDVEVDAHQLFLLAFAETRFGVLNGNGYLEGAGLEESSEFFSEGRVAYYLKGHVYGKYLITSAFDTETNELDSLFENFGPEPSQRFFRNLDPDKLYPVYGDGSTVTYDAESQGKFFLAIESDELRLLIGNQAQYWDRNELARYSRTLYGIHLAVTAGERTPYGGRATELVAFAAEVGQVHTRNELRATGGSIYYLSHDRVLEGSERVLLLVRDRRTGLILRRTPQRRNADYTIKYDEGRVVFRRPISSTSSDGTLIDDDLLSGNPVSIQIDYESLVDSFDETALGARGRQQIGDHVALGGTYLEDDQVGGSYELKGVDTEVRFGRNHRVVAEYAESEGADARTFTSTDGGLTYTESTADQSNSGAAWKVAAEVDLGELVGRPQALRLDAYYKKLEEGFLSSGNRAEEGTEKFGGNVQIRFGEGNSLLVRHHQEHFTRSLGDSLSVPDEVMSTSALWSWAMVRWGVKVEFLDRRSDGPPGTSLEAQYAAVELHRQLTSRLTGRVQHQQTFRGRDNDQTTLGLDYAATQSLALEARVTEGERGSAAELGAILTLGESRVYVTERFVDELGSSRSTTVVGAESSPGPISRVYTEYQWDRLTDRNRATSLIGIQQNWNTSRGFRFSVGGELAELDDGANDSRRSALVGQVGYGRDENLAAESRHELRYEKGVRDRRQFFTTNRLDYRLGPDFTLQGRYRYSKTEDRNSGAVEARLNEGSVGLAYRPVRHDRVNGLARYTRLSDLRPATLVGVETPERVMDVVSMEGVVSLARRLQWYSKGAIRVLDERYRDLPDLRTNTMLGIQRIDVRILDPIDVGIEYRLLHQREADDTEQGWVTELSRVLSQHLRVGVGYNFTDFSDDEFSLNDHSVHGWYFRVQGKY